MANTKNTTTKKTASKTPAKKAAPKKKSTKKAAPQKPPVQEKPLFRKKTIAERTVAFKTRNWGAVAGWIGIVFFSAYLLTKYVSLGSVLAAATFGIGFAVFHHDRVLVMLGGIFMAALTLYQHRGNIVRLVKGEERKTNLLQKGKKQ